MKYLFSLALFLFISAIVFPQNDNLPSHDNLYTFIKYLSVKGLIKNYDELMIPLPKKKILNYLEEAEQNPDITNTEKEFIVRGKTKLFPYLQKDIVDTFFTQNYRSILNDSLPPIIYSFKANGTALNIKPVLGDKYIYSSDIKSSTNLISFGFNVEAGYKDWFGISLTTENGSQYGNRNVALNDETIRHSYTFNKTGLNNFDNTEGYLTLNFKNINIEAGRERLLWGRGEEKLLLSDNPQVFDFLKFRFQFGAFSFSHLHGWLVQPSFSVFDSSINLYVKNKDPKYIAISRFGYNPSGAFNIGIIQSIIYANRPLELAYFNPFLLLESAQRSFNDLDNSFLGFDLNIKPVKGMNFSSAIMFDDLNFKTLGSEGFGSIQNRYALQAAFDFAYPLMFQNMTASAEFIEFRPYMYTHEGPGSSTLYTNNGYFLGAGLEPNSYKILFSLKYNISSFFAAIRFSHYEHGVNLYDASGKLTRNYGGSFNEFIRLGDSRTVKLLEGNLQVNNAVSFMLDYELLNSVNLGAEYNFSSHTSAIYNSNIFTLYLKINTL